MLLKKLITVRLPKNNILKSQVLRNASFGPIELPDKISQQLERKKIIEPTEIQNKVRGYE